LSVSSNVVFQSPVNGQSPIKSSIILIAHFWPINSLTAD